MPASRCGLLLLMGGRPQAGPPWAGKGAPRPLGGGRGSGAMALPAGPPGGLGKRRATLLRTTLRSSARWRVARYADPRTRLHGQGGARPGGFVA